MPIRMRLFLGQSVTNPLSHFKKDVRKSFVNHQAYFAFFECLQVLASIGQERQLCSFRHGQ